MAKRKGQEHGRAKLDEDQVKAIRTDGRYYRVIAAEYQVSRSTIEKIKRRLIWTHLP